MKFVRIATERVEIIFGLYPSWLFISSVIIMALSYSYGHEIFVRPHSWHQWRQTDGFSVALNYYEYDMNFFHPRVSQLFDCDGMALAEIPLVYYISACLYKIFGFHEWMLRVVTFSFFLLGLWHLFKLLQLLIEDNFYALFISLFLFTSPVIIFYAISSLPDIPGLALSISGLYFFVRGTRESKLSVLIISAICFALAGSFKPTSLIPFLTLTAVYFLNSVFDFTGISKTKLPGKPVHLLFFFFGVFALVFGWWVYVDWFKQHYHSDYFLNYPVPYWKAAPEQIGKIWERFQTSWIDHYQNKATLIVLLFAMVFSMLFTIRKNILWLIAFIIYFLGCVCYFLLFFVQFFDHDYYIIVLMGLPVAILIYATITIQTRKPEWLKSGWVKVLLLIFFSCNFAHAINKNNERIFKDDKSNNYPDFMEIEPYLRKLGIEHTDKVVVLGDDAPNTALYFMNQRGWNAKSFLPKRVSRSSIIWCINQGAKYLIINSAGDWADEEKRKELGINDNTKIGQYKAVAVYKLQRSLK